MSMRLAARIQEGAAHGVRAPRERAPRVDADDEPPGSVSFPRWNTSRLLADRRRTPRRARSRAYAGKTASRERGAATAPQSEAPLRLELYTKA